MWRSIKKVSLILFLLLPLSTKAQAAEGIHHLVFIWLNADTSSQQLETTIKATQALADIPGVYDFKVAKAIPSERAAVDDSFSFGITMRFNSQADMQDYLAADIHTDYLRDYIKGKAAKVVIHDF